MISFADQFPWNRLEKDGEDWSAEYDAWREKNDQVLLDAFVRAHPEEMMTRDDFIECQSGQKVVFEDYCQRRWAAMKSNASNQG